jgi:hypothetical protein
VRGRVFDATSTAYNQRKGFEHRCESLHNLPDHTARITRGECICWYIAGCDASRADHCAITDSNSGKDDRASADPYI